MVSPAEIVALLGGPKAIGRGIKTLADLDAVVHKGLPRSALDHVLEVAAPEPERAKLRNAVVPRASYQRNRRLSPIHSATTERLARITALAVWIWGDAHKAQEFLWRPHPELGGRRPIQAALSELGAREVEEVIERGVHGLPV
ncbi:MAG: DUF2384 domain-containing protein [Gammaproteobacteria bacterium]|nr:DUF2384 domain-containing protein [Gammaproteobacteria bacterium]